MTEQPKILEKDRGLRVDPLYLTALASLGQNEQAKIIKPPAAGSIAVLPFMNMSGDSEQEHFTDGLTEDIITDLSNVPGFFVIARNSTFTYKGKPTDVRQIAFDLGVKYVLEGSARRAGQSLRINVQLIDATEGGNHIWAERFDRELVNIFEVQDEITRRIVEAITGKLSASSDRNRPVNLEAYDLVVRSRNLWTESKVANQEAQSLLERALALDPNYAEAHWRLAQVFVQGWQNFGESQVPNRQKAVEEAERAVALDPNSSSSHWVLAYVLQGEHRWEEAKTHYATSLQLNPNDADAHAIVSDFEVLDGRPKDALNSAFTAIRLNPIPLGWHYWALGLAQVAGHQFNDAIATLRREETYRTGSRRILAAALALAGRTTEAREESRYYMMASPHWRISDWLSTRPFQSKQDADFWVEAYRSAGLPE